MFVFTDIGNDVKTLVRMLMNTILKEQQEISVKCTKDFFTFIANVFH